MVTPPIILHAASSSTTWRTGYCRPSSFSLLSSWFSSPTFCSRRSTKATTPRHCDVLVRNPWCVHCTAAWWGIPKSPLQPSIFRLAGPVLAFSSGASSAAGPFSLFFLFIPLPEAGALHPATGAALSTSSWRPSSNSCGPTSSSCGPYTSSWRPSSTCCGSFSAVLALPPAAVALLPATVAC